MSVTHTAPEKTWTNVGQKEKVAESYTERQFRDCLASCLQYLLQMVIWPFTKEPIPSRDGSTDGKVLLCTTFSSKPSGS